MQRHALPFSFSVGERKLMNHFVVELSCSSMTSGQRQLHAVVSDINPNAALVCPSMKRCPYSIFVCFDDAGATVGNDHARNAFLLAPDQLLPDSSVADKPIAQLFAPQNRPAHRSSITNIKLCTLESPRSIINPDDVRYIKDCSRSGLNPISHRRGSDRMHDRERLKIYPGNFFDLSNRQETTVGLFDRKPSHHFPRFLHCVNGTGRSIFKAKSVIGMTMCNHDGVRLK